MFAIWIDDRLMISGLMLKTVCVVQTVSNWNSISLNTILQIKEMSHRQLFQAQRGQSITILTDM